MPRRYRRSCCRRCYSVSTVAHTRWGCSTSCPSMADSVWPTCAVPETAGNAVLTGTDGDAAVMRVVWVESAGVLGPVALVAVTRARRVEPTSAACRSVGRGGRGADVCAGGAGGVAAAPLVGVGGRAAGPGAVCGGQCLALGGGSRDDRWGGVCGCGWGCAACELDPVAPFAWFGVGAAEGWGGGAGGVCVVDAVACGGGGVVDGGLVVCCAGDEDEVVAAGCERCRGERRADPACGLVCGHGDGLSGRDEGAGCCAARGVDGGCE